MQTPVGRDKKTPVSKVIKGSRRTVGLYEHVQKLEYWHHTSSICRSSMTEIRMNLNFEGEQPLEQLDTIGRHTYEVSASSLTAPRFSYENDTCVYPSDTCAKLASSPVTFYNGMVDTLNTTVDPWQHIITTSAGFAAYTVAVKYVRFDVKVLIRVITCPTAYGIIIISTNPVDYTLTYDYLNGNPLIIDAGKGDTTEFIVPWESNYEFYNLSKLMKIGKMVFTSYAETSVSTGSKPRVEIIFTPINIRAKGAKGSFQMETAEQAARSYPMASALGGLVATMGSATYAVNYIKGVTTEAKTLANSATEIYEQAKPYVEHLQWKVVESENLQAPTGNNPTVYGQLSGVDYVPACAVTNPYPDVIKPYHVGELLQEHGMLQTARIPCIREVFSIPLNMIKSWYFEPGIYQPGRVNVTYVDYISRMFRFWRGSMDLNFRIYMPSLSTADFTFFFRNVEAFGDATVAATAAPSQWAFTKHFTVRGTASMSVRLPYISERQWTRCGLTNAASQFVRMWEVGLAMVKMESGGDTSVTPYVVLISRPGPDFQFKSLKSCVTDPHAEAQMWVRSEFEEPPEEWGMKTPRRYRHISEDDLTLEKICNRWSSRVISQNHLSNTTSGVELIQADNLDYIMSMFAYQRGSIRWLVRTGGTSASPVLYMGSSTFGLTPTPRVFTSPAGRGIVIGDPATNPVTKLETTWDSALEWGLTQTYLETGTVGLPGGEMDEWYGAQMIIANFEEQSTFAYAASGRGFQLARLLPPVLTSAAF